MAREAPCSVGRLLPLVMSIFSAAPDLHRNAFTTHVACAAIRSAAIA
jgi:hypothetical protein